MQFHLLSVCSIGRIHLLKMLQFLTAFVQVTRFIKVRKEEIVTN